jgi:hypothetical protein
MRIDVRQIDREDLLAEDVLETLLRQSPLHRHLAALEAEPRAMVPGASLLALDAATGLLAGSRTRATAHPFAVPGGPARALQFM